jgi:beta-glucosidase-like glycosyl hydrolase
VGIVRDARWGCNLETPGEDPYLNGQFGTQYSLGLQNNPEETRFIQAVVTLKHFDANSLEGDWVGPGSEAKYPGSGCPGKICTRHTVDPNISLYDLASTYLPAFKSSVMEGGALGVMCSYNSINGVPSCANEWLLETQLRKQWNFEGYVTGDSGAVKDIATSHFYTPDLETACIKAVSAGCDIESAPWKSGQRWATGGPFAEFLPQAIQKGTLDEKILDLAVARSVSLRFRMGLFDPIEDQPLWNISKDVVHSTQHVAAAFESTDQGLVLLQNPSGLLPFDPSLSTAIIGPQSLSRAVLVENYLGQICPGLDSKGGENFDCVENLAEAVANLTSAAPIIVEGLEKVTSMNESQFKKAIDAAKVSKQVIMFLGNDGTVEGEGHDRHEVTLPGAQQHLFDVVYQVNRNIVVVLLNGGAIAIDKIKSSDVGIIEAWYPGIYGASSVARSIFGKTNRWGKLPITIYSESQANSFDMLNFDMGSSPGRTYRYFTGKPLWNFGHGLSYSKFNLSHSASNSQKIFNLSRDGLPLSIRIRVQNVGEVEGDEVVMAYFKPATTTLPSGAPASKIVKQLFDFQRVQLNSGESTDLAFVVSANTLPLFDENGNRVLFPGLYELIFTNGVEQTVTVSVNITGASPQIIELLNPVTKM